MGAVGEFFARVVGEVPLVQGLVAGLLIADLNMVGALAVLVWRRPSERWLNAALGFAAGVMLTASFTSLILPGVERAGIFPVLAGLALGVLALARAEAWVPHVHLLITGGTRADTTTPVTERVDRRISQKRSAGAVYFIVAITLHNMPEGLAVGVGFGSGDINTGIALMLAIGLQNIPEGLAVAVAARSAALGSGPHAALTGIRAGLVEVPLILLGVAATSVAAPLLPYAMGFAAGGMLYIISDEIIPETHTSGHERAATLGTLLGVAVMLYLDVSLG